MMLLTASKVGARTRGMTAGQEGSFQNPGVCLQAFPSFLPHPVPALLLAPFFAQFLTLVPHSLLLKRAETLVTQATPRGGESTPIHYLYGYVPPNGVVILKLLI